MSERQGHGAKLEKFICKVFGLKQSERHDAHYDAMGPDGANWSIKHSTTNSIWLGSAIRRIFDEDHILAVYNARIAELNLFAIKLNDWKKSLPPAHVIEDIQSRVKIYAYDKMTPSERHLFLEECKNASKDYGIKLCPKLGNHTKGRPGRLHCMCGLNWLKSKFINKTIKNFGRDIWS